MLPAVLLNLLQSLEQTMTALGRRVSCPCLGKRLMHSLLSRAQCMDMHKHNTPVVQGG